MYGVFNISRSKMSDNNYKVWKEENGNIMLSGSRMTHDIILFKGGLWLVMIS